MTWFGEPDGGSPDGNSRLEMTSWCTVGAQKIANEVIQHE
jgi:hypothetical protein